MIPSHRNEAAQMIAVSRWLYLTCMKYMHDQHGLGRGDRHRGQEVQHPQRHIGGPDRREQQDHERDKNIDVGLDRRKCVASLVDVDQIEQGIEEDPDDVDEVPVQPGDLDLSRPASGKPPVATIARPSRRPKRSR